MTKFITGDKEEAKSISIEADKNDVNIMCDDELIAWFKGETNELVIEDDNLGKAGLTLKHN